MIRKILYIILLVISCAFNVSGQDDPVLSKYFKALYYYQHEYNDSALIQLEQCNNDTHCEMLRGKILYKTGEYTKAINVFKSLIENEPYEASFNLSLIFAEMGFADESVVWLEKYFEYNTPAFYSQIIANPEYNNISRTSEWREFWNVNRYPKNYDSFEDALYMINSGKYFDAISLLKTIDASSRDYYKNYLLALSHFYLDKFSESNKYVDLSLSSRPKYTDAYKLKYIIAKKNKDYNTCHNTLNTLMKIDKYEPLHILEKADIYFLSSKYKEAEECINEYTKYFIDDERANLLKSKILTKTNKPSEALVALNELINSNPSVPEYFTLRADIHYDFESWNFAKNDYSMSLDIDPNQPETYYKLGVCYFKQNITEKACYNWNKAMQMKHNAATKMIYKYCN